MILLKSKFSGDARKVILNSKSLNEEINYENFKTKIREEFKAKENFEEIQQEFSTIKQNPEHSMSEFIKIFDAIAQKYIDIAGHATEVGAVNFFQKLKLTRFLEAIRKDIAFEIRKMGPKDYAQATEYAKTLERAFNFMPKEEVNYVKESSQKNVTQTFENMTSIYEDKIAKLNEELAKLKLEKQNEGIKQKKYCEICSKDNHDTKDCFYNGKTNNKLKRQENKKGYRFPNTQMQNFPQMQKNRDFLPYNQMPYNQNGAMYQLQPPPYVTPSYVPNTPYMHNMMGTNYNNMGDINSSHMYGGIPNQQLIPHANMPYPNMTNNFDPRMSNFNNPNQNYQPFKYQGKNKQNTHNKNSMFSGKNNYKDRYNKKNSGNK